jgi:hypothetical protein
LDSSQSLPPRLSAGSAIDQSEFPLRRVEQ